MGALKKIIRSYLLPSSRESEIVSASSLTSSGLTQTSVVFNISIRSSSLIRPAKVTYSLLGGLTGGFAYALTGGDLQTAETVWVTTMGGTYVVTPRMLQGEDPIAFSGTPSSDNTATGDTDNGGGFYEQRLGDS